MTKALAVMAQFFLALGLLSWVAWIYTRFRGPIGRVSYEGFLILTLTCLGFVIASALCHMVVGRKDK
jgi:hypothetical protein